MIAPVDPLVRALPDGTDVFAVLRHLSATRAKRVTASLTDPLERAVGEALVALEQGKRVGPHARSSRRRSLRIRLTSRLARRCCASRRARSRDGADAEAIVRPPLSDAERALAAGWVAPARSDGRAERCARSILSSPRFRPSIRSESTRCGCGSRRAWPAATRARGRGRRSPRRASAIDAIPRRSCCGPRPRRRRGSPRLARDDRRARRRSRSAGALGGRARAPRDAISRARCPMTRDLSCCGRTCSDASGPVCMRLRRRPRWVRSARSRPGRAAKVYS